MTIRMKAGIGRWVLCTGFALVVGGTGARAQLIPLEPAHLVNVTTASDQRDPDVDSAPGGGYVVTWASEGDAWPDHRIFARRFGADGAPLESEFEVGNQASDYYARPRVAVNAAGGFLVAWRQATPGGSTVLARAYGSGGAPLGPPFEIHSQSAGSQEGPDVASDPDGGYLVVWNDTADDGVAVRARRVSNAGARVGGAFPVVTTDFVDHVAVDTVGPGRFLVAWNRPPEQDNYGVYFRWVESDGTLGPRRYVGGGPVEYGVGYVRLAALSDGSAVVTWANEIYHSMFRWTRQMSASGAVVADFPWAPPDDGWIASAPDDTWMMMWYGWQRVRVQFHSPDGRPVGSEFDLEAEPMFETPGPFAFDGDSRPVVLGLRYEDAGIGYDVYARRFEAMGVFLDDFDSGDTSAWSLVEP